MIELCGERDEGGVGGGTERRRSGIERGREAGRIDGAHAWKRKRGGGERKSK